MPRVPMLTPDLKFCLVPLPTNFSSQIKEYILLHYQDDPMKYDWAIGEIESMRSKLSRLLPDLETLSVLKRYYAQLCLMKNRFPMEKGDSIRVAFSWMNKSNDMSNPAVFEDINYELACIMYNIGAVHGAIAANEPRTELDSIKNAFTHFQCAAYPFQQIRDSMNAVKYSAFDFDPSVLTFYSSILLAQAQECLLEKSIIDRRKNTVIAKLAMHLRDVYMQCREHFDSTCLNDVLSSRYKEWLRTCIVKSEIYGAIAMLHLGFQAEEDNKMGFRVSYFDFALEHVTSAIKHAEKDKRESLKDAVVFLNDVILGKQRNAKKENDFIYHDRIPKAEELTTVEGVNMVKAVGFDPTDRSIAGPDLFAALLPGNVLKSLSVYSEEKAKFKRAILEKVAAKDRELEDYIKSLQLEEINFDDDSKMEELPEMLLERSAAFNSQPDAFPELLDKLHRVGDCALEADHKTNNLRNRLDAISSRQLRNDEGFIAIMKELNRVNDHHMKARTNNAELQRALAAHSESLKILAMPLKDLRKRLTDIQTRPADSSEGLTLKKMLDKANEMSTQRRNLLSKLNEDLLNDDITAKCLAEKNEDNWGLYESELKKHEETTTLINLNLAAQDNILSALTDANANFGDYRKKIVEENKRLVLALTAAYDVYVDVSLKTDEGLKFYSTLFSIVKSLEEAVEAIETAFEEEKEEKEKDLLREIEERAGGSGKWNSSAKSAKSGQSDILLGSGNERNENPLEAGCKGLRLKDCLEYYRNNIAKGSASLSCHTQNSQALGMSPIPHGDQILSNQLISSSFAPQFSKYQNSVPLQSHFTPISNQPQPMRNVPLDSTTKEMQQPFMFPGRVSPLSYSLQASVLSESRPISSDPHGQKPSAPQSIATFPSHFSINQHTSASVTPFSPATSDISRPVSTVTAAQLVGGQSMMASSISSLAKMPVSSSLNYTPNLHTSSSAILQQPALIPRLADLNTTGVVEVKKTFDTTTVHPQVYISPFASAKTLSNFGRPVVSTSSMSTIAKPVVAPTFTYPQNGSSTVSPWHQSLRNVDANGLLTNTGVVHTPSSAKNFPLFNSSNHVTLTTRTPAVETVARTTPVADIMNAPLDVVLPTPLTPMHLLTENEKSDLNVQIVTADSVSSTGPTKVNLVQTQPQLSESMQQTVGLSLTGSTVVQTPRPAAAVAPIMQTDCITTSAQDSTLCITNFLHASSYTGRENGAEDQWSSNVKEVMDPQTFTIGNTDPVRLEKRYMREQFKMEGVSAQLPPLDPADPINCIDAHYWLNKS
uniref:BRO1 domain-containing protein n=1 Tax=Setaria digitata TaxID=48799 RepID=A0A915PT48_9BILA